MCGYYETIHFVSINYCSVQHFQNSKLSLFSSSSACNCPYSSTYFCARNMRVVQLCNGIVRYIIMALWYALLQYVRHKVVMAVTMRNNIFRDTLLCSLADRYWCLCLENGGSTVFQNAGTRVPDYTVSHHRRLKQW